MKMPLMITVATDNLRRLLFSWVKPGAKHRKLKEGRILRKVSPRALIVKDEDFMKRLLLDVKWRNPDDVFFYRVEELSTDQLLQELKGENDEEESEDP